MTISWLFQAKTRSHIKEWIEEKLQFERQRKNQDKHYEHNLFLIRLD